MTHEMGTLNGSEAFIIYKLGRLEISVENNTADIRALTRRLDTSIAPKRASLKQRAGDIAPYLTGLLVLALAMAGEWEKLGLLLRGFAR